MSSRVAPDVGVRQLRPRRREARPLRRHRSPGRGRLAAALVALLLCGLVGGSAAEGARLGTAGAADAGLVEDALHRRVLSELAGFTTWLQDNGVEGYVGEIGIPSDGDPRWLALADRWLVAAERAGLWVDAWAVGEWWGATYDYCAFLTPVVDGPVSIARPSGELLARHARRTDLPRGMNLNGAEFGAPGSTEDVTDFSNENPGVPGRDYHYNSQATWDYLADQGFDTVRLPFRWERIQPRLDAPLDEAELGRLRGAVDRARQAGLRVVLDVHNYGAYHLADGGRGVRRGIGSDQVGGEQFADLWRRLAEAFAGDPSVAAYDLMNEPSRLPDAQGRTAARLWEEASQEAVTAIRATGDDTLVMVAGYGYSQAAGWAEQHPRAWIDDPAGRIRYTAHHYWRLDYHRTYDEEVADAEAAGF